MKVPAVSVSRWTLSAVRAFRRHARPPGGDEHQMVRGVALVVGGFAGGDLLAHEHRRQVGDPSAAFMPASTSSVSASATGSRPGPECRGG